VCARMHAHDDARRSIRTAPRPSRCCRRTCQARLPS
jgi:hypothetical protein